MFLKSQRILYFQNTRKSYFTKAKEFECFSDKPECHLVKNDYIGPPDKESNLRPYIRSVSKPGHCLALKLRKKQIEVEQWNQLFWSRHNKRFYEEKQSFLRLHNLSEKNVSADKMSEFYKTFLDKNQNMHILYNISWYTKNLQILVLAFGAMIENFYKNAKI